MKRTKRRGIFTALGLISVLLFGMVFGGILLLGDSPGSEVDTETDCSPDSAVPKEINVKNLPTTKVGSYNKQQLANAAVIINEAKSADVQQQGAIIGLMTAIQESSLKILANDGTWKYPQDTNVMTEAQWAQARKVVIKSLDLPHQGVVHAWDALSLMQQRPSAGWGTVEQIMDPSYAASTFFDRLKKFPAGSPCLTSWPLKKSKSQDCQITTQRSALMRNCSMPHCKAQRSKSATTRKPMPSARTGETPESRTQGTPTMGRRAIPGGCSPWRASRKSSTTTAKTAARGPTLARISAHRKTPRFMLRPMAKSSGPAAQTW